MCPVLVFVFQLYDFNLTQFCAHAEAQNLAAVAALEHRKKAHLAGGAEDVAKELRDLSQHYNDALGVLQNRQAQLRHMMVGAGSQCAARN